jgi:hypothetical protein
MCVGSAQIPPHFTRDLSTRGFWILRDNCIYTLLAVLVWQVGTASKNSIWLFPLESLSPLAKSPMWRLGQLLRRSTQFSTWRLEKWPQLDPWVYSAHCEPPPVHGHFTCFFPGRCMTHTNRGMRQWRCSSSPGPHVSSDPALLALKHLNASLLLRPGFPSSPGW